MSEIFTPTQNELCVSNYITSFDWTNSYCVTLTLKQVAKSFYEKTNSYYYVKGDYISYTANLRHLLNRINQKVYGNAVRRFGKKLNSFSVFEGGVGRIRPHFHLLLEASPYHERDQFERLIKREWANTNYGYNEVYTLKHVEGLGWEGYISKEYSKTNLFDCVDWENVNIMDKG